jgi:hypothetical protein
MRYSGKPPSTRPIFGLGFVSALVDAIEREGIRKIMKSRRAPRKKAVISFSIWITSLTS